MAFVEFTVRDVDQCGQQIRPCGGHRKVNILFMDDEGLIRTLAAKMAATLGHKLECAEHGQEAIEKFERAVKAGKCFDIVILDLMVRDGMGGTETVKRLKDIDPRIKAIASSGYTDNPVASDHASYGFDAFLAKPYKIEELEDILDALLA